MGRRDLFLPLALALNLTACTDAVTPTVLPDVQNVTSTRSLGVPVAPEIAQAGCTIGRAIDESRSRILMLARSELPFRMPQMHTVRTTARGKVVYEMKKFALRPDESTRQQVFLSCIVPMFGEDSRQIASALAAIPNQQRLQVAERLEREGENVSEPLSLAIGNVLRKKLFPKSRLVSRGTSSDTTGMCCDPPRLGTIQVTARSNYSIITYASLAAFLSSFDEGSHFNHERYVDYEEWSRLCEDYQLAYWDWRSSQDQADAAASEMALTLTEIADALYTAAVELEGAEDSCQRVGAGKRLCIDFFIAQCSVGPVMGDCRNFDPDALFTQSRVQLYVNPTTREWEVKWSDTKIVYTVCAWRCISVPVTSSDSANMFDPSQDVVIKPFGSDGSFDVTVALRNNACWHRNVACSAINVDLRFRANGNAVGGFDIYWAGNTSPSIGVYNESSAGFQTMKEIPQKSRKAVGFIRGLIDGLNEAKQLPPPENPNSCSLT